MLRVSSKVKLSADVATPTLTSAALALVTLGTGLVLVTYVTPMATVADSTSSPRRCSVTSCNQPTMATVCPSANTGSIRQCSRIGRPSSR